MKLKIKTSILQGLLSKALKGMGGNKMVPITTFIGIELKDNILTLHTMDGTNYLDVKAGAKVEGEDFSLTLTSDQFPRLVSKTTSEYIELEVTENSLNFKGNGEYKIDIPMDEGEFIVFPKAPEVTSDATCVEVQVTTIKKILSTNSKSVARSLEEPVYTGYFICDKVITTDSYVVCVNDIKVLDTKKLFTETFLNLITLSDKETVKLYYTDGGQLWVDADAVRVYGSVLESPTGEDYVTRFPYDSVMAYVNENFGSMCKLPRASVDSILDRLSLFITPYDKNALNFRFTKDGLIISSKSSTGTEMVAYTESKNFQDFECQIDVETLKSQLSAQDSEVITMYYGHESAIKMVDGKLTQVVSLLEE